VPRTITAHNNLAFKPSVLDKQAPTFLSPKYPALLISIISGVVLLEASSSQAFVIHATGVLSAPFIVER